MISLILQKDLFSSLVISAIKVTACQFVLKLHSLFSPAGMIAGDDFLTHIRHPLGNLTLYNISKLDANQLVLNSDGSLGWGDSCGVILPLTVLRIYTS